MSGADRILHENNEEGSRTWKTGGRCYIMVAVSYGGTLIATVNRFDLARCEDFYDRSRARSSTRNYDLRAIAKLLIILWF